MGRRRSLAVGLVLFVGAGIASCATSGRSNFVVVLPNGYLIERNEAADPMLIKRSGGKVIPKPVAAYTVYRDVVTGIMKSSRPASGPAENQQDYFVLDTRSGQVNTGLAEAAWNGRLKELGVPASPRLSPPVLPE